MSHLMPLGMTTLQGHMEHHHQVMGLQTQAINQHLGKGLQALATIPQVQASIHQVQASIHQVKDLL